MNKTNWKLTIKHPATLDKLEEKEYQTITEIAKAYPHISVHTWRNISVGRSKVYKNFIDLAKLANPITINFE